MNNIEILEFYADWCGPCKALSYELEDFPYDIKKINVDDNKPLTKVYGVLSIPTIVILRDNNEVMKIHGFIHKDELIEKINEVK